MKKFLVIGNPIEHSLSPRLHNYWIKQNNIKATYDKKLINEENIENLIFQIKKGEIDGINVTVPFKKSVIPFIETLTPEANESYSVNTIYVKDKKIIGHNTDIAGFELGIRHLKYNIKDKKVFILGAGGVVSSIILGLKKMGASKIIISNRTMQKAKDLKKNYSNLELINWGEIPEFDMIINATSLGLRENDKFGIDFSISGNNKLFFDVIYNPFNTDFSEAGNKSQNILENGLYMFLFQAQKAFSIWHNVEPEINQDVIKFLKSNNQ